MTPAPLRLGTRGSPLALAQTERIRDLLVAARPDLGETGLIETVVVHTTGDRVQNRALADIGGKGLFTKELEEALFDQRVDAAVHSMKDMPTWLPDGLALAGTPAREDPRDVLISRSGLRLDELPAGSVIGTAGLRRQAQILERRPDLRVVPFRGNVRTRLDKLTAGEVDATLLALAGLARLDLVRVATEILEPEVMLPAAAQGAVAIEIRADDETTRNLFRIIDDPVTGARVTAERAVLEVLDGSCRTPIAALAEVTADRMRLRAKMLTPDGRRSENADIEGPLAEAEALGRRAGTMIRERMPTCETP